jgi:secreted trypsin-like serine protease
MIHPLVPRSLLALVLGLASAAAGCSARPGDAPGAANTASTGEIGANASKLVGGTADAADPAVVLFETTGNNGGDCTAEFISTTVLLTAAHCTLDDTGKPLVGAQYRIYLGSDYAQVTAADWITIDPSNVHPNPAYNGNDNDIAVLVLTKPVAVTPLPWNSQPLAQSSIGQPARLVGYGSNVQGAAASGANGGFGLKRQLTTTVGGFDAGFVHIGMTGKNGCDGDSGGPALVTIGGVETIIGLDSYSAQQVDCTGGDYYQRVDTQAAFINSFMNGPTAADAGTSGPADSGADASSSSGGAASSSGTAAAPASGDEPDASTSSAGTGAETSGCSVEASRRAHDAQGAGVVAPWLGFFALLAMRRRRTTA